MKVKVYFLFRKIKRGRPLREGLRRLLIVGPAVLHSFLGFLQAFENGFLFNRGTSILAGPALGLGLHKFLQRYNPAIETFSNFVHKGPDFLMLGVIKWNKDIADFILIPPIVTGDRLFLTVV